MQAYQIAAFGLEQLARVELPDPVPGPGQVVVGVRAASLNYRDLMMVQGRYDPRQALPLVPLSDGAGEVLAVGAGVTRVSVGARVAGVFNQGWLAGAPGRAARKTTLGGPLPGMLAERALLSAEGVVPIPDHLSFAQAATLPCAGVTAWTALMDDGGVRPGETVLVQGTGGVSTFALQLAHAAGARVIATSSSPEKLARARELGAWATIDYRATPDWEQEVRRLTEGEGVDLVVEVGGAETLRRSLGCVRLGGRIAIIGVLSGRKTELDLAPVLMQRVRLQGVFVGSRAHFEALNRAVAAQRLEPVIDRVFPFAAAPAAFEHLAAGRHQGKVVISLEEAA
ncbi:MAG: NAD(P)-dependent alcohol dehydrogenase [Planctomycetota bacterium]